MSERARPDLKGSYILLLNWNGWKDSIACLESLLPNIARGARVILCDNASSDDSLSMIQRWANATLSATRPGLPRLDRLQSNSNAKPRTQLLQWNNGNYGRIDPEAELILLDNGANRGFAAGNNTGLRLALAQSDMRHVWLLNNDTLVEPDCLAQMHRRLNEHGGLAVCGSVIHFFDQPAVIQCLGGNRFDRRRGRALQSEGRYLTEEQVPDAARIEGSLDYLSGCSMLLPRQFLEEVGLMSEEYFLYYEEIDWFTRAAGRFDLVVARDARLYHREGGSIGSRSWNRGPSRIADMHMFRSRRRFMQRYYPDNLWHCTLSNWIDVGKRLAKGQWRNAVVIARELTKSPPAISSNA
jgi:GT2 family glycosyltransferase